MMRRERLAFTWGRRAQNASSEWNELKLKLFND